MQKESTRQVPGLDEVLGSLWGLEGLLTLTSPPWQCPYLNEVLAALHKGIYLSKYAGLV